MTSILIALDEKVDTVDIDIVNKWEHSGGSVKRNMITTLPMKLHYVEFEILKNLSKGTHM